MLQIDSKGVNKGRSRRSKMKIFISNILGERGRDASLIKGYLRYDETLISIKLFHTDITSRL